MRHVARVRMGVIPWIGLYDLLYAETGAIESDLTENRSEKSIC